MFTKIVMVMCLTLVFHDVEDDGQHNYLVHQPESANEVEWLVAFNSPKDVYWHDGCFKVNALCDLSTQALDDVPALAGAYPFGVPRRAPICNAISIDGENFHWDEKSK